VYQEQIPHFFKEGASMKYIYATAIVIMLVSTSAISQTDSSTIKTPEFSFSAGPVVPYLPYPFKNFWKAGYEINAGYGYTLSAGSWGYGSIYGVVGYDRFPFDKSGLTTELKLNPNDVIEGNATTALTIMAVAKGTFTKDKQAIAPFFTVGIGYMNVTSGEITFAGVTARPKDTRGGVAYQVGIGLDVPVNEKVKLFAEGKFLMGFTSDPGRQYFPIVLGARIAP
jgi:hypothetical protein